MEALDWARWQFGITTVYHFLFVPLTIGLSTMVALMQTFAYAQRKKNPEHSAEWLRLVKFFGNLLIVNFALGAATGIVQEFQFGMNWSEYSRFVGDIFGAPLAFEGLAAFFLESTFLGLWIFGWGRLKQGVHLATVWLFAIGTTLSAYFIISANSFMQHPVAATFNESTGRAELDPSQGGIFALLSNITALYAFPHVIAGAWLTAAAFVTGIATWHMVRHSRAAKGLPTKVATPAEGEYTPEQHEFLATHSYRPAVRFGLVFMIIAGVLLIMTGDLQAKLMFKQQPEKMAAAEALCQTTEGAGFSILSIGGVDTFNQSCDDVTRIIEVPGALSFLAESDFNATLRGVDELQEHYAGLYGETWTTRDGQVIQANYIPNLFTTYWAFRLMIGFAAFSAAVALLGLWFTRKGRSTAPAWFGKFALWTIPMPFLANAAGWVFTEIGRQPWVVHPAPDGPVDVSLLTLDGVSHTPAWQVIVSLVVFTLLYGVLAIAWYRLTAGTAAKGVKLTEADPDADDAADQPMTFSY